jgi:flagellar biosynthesis protein FliR
MSAAVVTFVLALARLSAIAWTQVLWRTVVPGWGVVAVGLSAIVALTVRAPEGTTLPAGGTLLLVLAALEVMLGLVIGLLAALPGYALLGATSVSAWGLRTARGPLTHLGVCLSLAVALGLGLHRPLLGALLETFAVLPLADPGAWLHVWGAQGGLLVVRGAHAMLVLALALATPVLLTAAVADLVVRLVAAGPGPVSIALGPLEGWLRVAAGVLALGASWAAYGHVWAEAAVRLPG